MKIGLSWLEGERVFEFFKQRGYDTNAALAWIQEQVADKGVLFNDSAEANTHIFKIKRKGFLASRGKGWRIARDWVAEANEVSLTDRFNTVETLGLYIDAPTPTNYQRFRSPTPLLVSAELLEKMLPRRTSSRIEQNATNALVELLRLSGDSKPKPEYLNEIRKTFSVSENGFDTRIWPKARREAGLAERPRAGRKNKER